MASYDEEIRVAIIATAEGVQAGTDEAASAIEDFNTRVTAAQTQAAAAYDASQRAWADAQARVGQVLAETQSASVAQITEAYDALNAARDANLANAQAYLTELSANQQAALGVEDYAAQAAAQSLAEQVIAERAAAEAAYEASAAQLEAAAGMDADTAATEADTAAQVEDTAAKVGNTGATIGLTEAVAGLARGNVGMAAYGMARMGIATRAMSALMTPAGLAIAGMTAALVGFGVAAVEGSLQSQRLEDALLATGNASGQTLGQLQAMAGQLASGDTTIGDARDAILALAQSGKFAGQGFQQAAQAVVDFASLTGQSTQQAAKYVEQLATATTQQLIKANEQYHFLTLAQFTQIEELRAQGKQAQATEAIMDAFYGAMHTRAQTAIQDEGYLARAWDDVKRAVSGTIAAMESWGSVQAPTQQIAALEQQLKAVQARDPYNVTGVATHIEAEIAALKKLQAQNEATAAAAAKANAAQQNAIVAKYGTESAHGHAAAVGGYPVPAESASGASAEIAQDARILDALQRQAERRVQIAEQVNSINENAARSHAQALLQIHLDQLRTEEAQGKITHAQELAGEQKLYAEEYAQQMAAYQRELAIDDQKPAEKARIYAEIEALHDKHLQRMAAAQLAAANKQAQDFKQALTPMEQAFSTSINGIIMGTQTMQMAVGNILDSIMLKYIDLAIRKTITWATSEQAMTAATVMGSAERWIATEAAEAKTIALKILNATKSIIIDAAEGGAAAFKAIVGIPYVGPVLAPAAAAAAVVAIKDFAKFDQGAWNIPHDMPAMVHAGETILPRPFAEDFRRNGGNLGGGAGGDTYNLHVHAVDGDSVRRLFMDHGEHIAAAMSNQIRTGWRP